MREVERQIVEKLVSTALGLGYEIRVFDGEEWPAIDGGNQEAIMGEVAATDETTLHFMERHGADGSWFVAGWVLLVHGNDCDVLSDWTDNEATTKLVNPALQVALDLEHEGN